MKIRRMFDLNSRQSYRLFKFALSFSLVGFVLNLAWEYLQCSSFFRHIKIPPTLSAMVLVTLGDVAMMWVIYLMAAVATRSLAWFQAKSNLGFICTLGSSILVSIIVEQWALKENRWTYTELNPLLPFVGVSVLPVLQMVIITPISIYSSKIFLNRLA